MKTFLFIIPLLTSMFLGAQTYVKENLISSGANVLAIKGNTLYAGDFDGVLTYDLTSLSTPPDTLYSLIAGGGVSGITINENDLYLVTLEGTALIHIDLTTSMFDTICSGLEHSESIVYLDNNLYITGGFYVDKIYKVDLSNPTAYTAIIDDPNQSMRNLAVLDGEIYFTTHPSAINKLNLSTIPNTFSQIMATSNGKAICSLDNKLFSAGEQTGSLDVSSGAVALSPYSNDGALTLTSDNGILYGSDLSSIYKFIDPSTVGVSEFENDVLISENPVRNTFTINSDFDVVKIFNLQGQLMYTQLAKDGNQIKSDFLTPGVYFLQTELNTVKSAIKMIKE